MRERWRQWVIKKSEEYEQQVVALSRAIYLRPELGYEEFFASQLLADFLEGQGFKVMRGAAGLPTAFIARYAGRPGGPVVAFLAEYDALPELGHACGHNLIGAAAVGAGAIVRQALEHLPGAVLVYGTPAEETSGAKVTLVEAGAFQGVDAALMFHPGNINAVEIGSLAMEALEFTFRGRAAHAVAGAGQGVNALEALLLFFQGVNSLRPYLGEGVCLHGIISEGGISPNVIPERAVARFYIRARQLGQLELAVRRVKECAQAAAAMLGASVEWRNFEFSYQRMLSNPVLGECFKRNLAFLGVNNIAGPREALGSIDMGNVSQVVPSLHPYLCLSPQLVPHSREFAVAAGSREGEEVLLLAVKALALTALELYLQPFLVERAWEELHRQLGRR